MYLRPLPLLLIAYILLASVYSVVTPIFEASDELWHYPMVKYLADNGALPVQRPEEARQSEWRQEGSQPPLYYMMAALLTFWIDDSNLPAVRRLNPHADIGVVVPDGNANMTIHDPAVRAFPWHGAALAIHIARFFSVALGAITVFMTYRLADELFPLREGVGPTNWLAFAAACFTAFNPMFFFISGSVNNDNLSTALASWLLVLIVRLLKRADRPAVRELAWIGVLAGAGMLAKFNIGFLLPVIALALAALAYRLHDPGFFLRGALITGGLTILIGGWWYVRNWQLYGDPTGLNIFLDIVGRRPIPANWAQLWSERHTFLMSYWGFFGGLNVPLPDVVYTVFNGIAALSLIGLVVGLISPLPTIGGEVNRPILLGRLVTLLWIVVLFAGLIRWTSETWASQGRLLFAAIAPISLWMAAGLWALGSAIPLVRLRLAGIAVIWFVAAGFLSLLAIYRAYADPYAGDNLNELIVQPVAFTAEFFEPGRSDPSIRADESTFTPDVQVGQYLEFCRGFELPQAGYFTRDWSVFIHIENMDGVIIAQRDVFLGQGLWATSLLRPGLVPDAWCNRFAIKIPDHAYAPQSFRTYIGFYQPGTDERMIARGTPGHSQVWPDDRLFLGVGHLYPRESSLPYPNPMTVNLGDEAELIGYDFAPSSLLAHQGDQVTVTLYWRAKRPMSTDYRVFAQIVQPNTTNVFARSDAMPAAWMRPTSTWQPGEVIEDRHTLTIDRDAPPGTWQLIVGMYELKETPQGQQFVRLRVITSDGGQAEDYVALTRVKVDPAEVF